jgi:hypothetical protein
MSELEHTSPSEELIPPEIIYDRFYYALQWLVQHERLHHILEIGSSSGDGSTKAFVEGILRNPVCPVLHCIEVSGTRHSALQNAYGDRNFVKTYNVSSVPEECFPLDEEIIDFYNQHRTALNQYPIEVILSWKAEGLRYLRDSGVQQRGIAAIKSENQIKNFDLVLIDGAEFTGFAEFREIYGANIICMDDVNAFKCYRARRELLADRDYELVFEDFSIRNGFSIFIRKDFPSQWLYVKRSTESLQLRGHAINERDASAAERDVIAAERDVLAAEHNVLNNRLDARVAELRQSRSWRMTAKLRRHDEDRPLAGLPLEAKLDVLLAALGSLSWELTAPLRLPRRLLHRLCR